jgi:hypothetical protein
MEWNGTESLKQNLRNVTDSMELSPSWETATYAATEEFHNTFLEHEGFIVTSISD